MARFLSSGRGLVLSCFVLLCLVTVGCLNFAQSTKQEHQSDGSQRIKAFWVRINDDESLEYEWKINVEKQFYKNRVTYSGYLIRTVNGVPRRYFVSEDTSLPETLELRCSRKEGHVWLVQPEMNDSGATVARVVGSLDRQSGKFINNYRMIVDWRLSEVQQEAIERPREQAGDLSQEQPLPSWAKPTGGTTLCKTGALVLHEFIRN